MERRIDMYRISICTISDTFSASPGIVIYIYKHSILVKNIAGGYDGKCKDYHAQLLVNTPFS